MAIYELRTYTLYVGKMAEAVKLYQEIGFPAMVKGEHDMVPPEAGRADGHFVTVCSGKALEYQTAIWTELLK